MKNSTILALIATLGLAAPALAQTPADVKAFRGTIYDRSTAVDAPAPVAEPVKVEEKKPAKKSSKKKKSSTKVKTEEKKEEKKEEVKEEKK